MADASSDLGDLLWLSSPKLRCDHMIEAPGAPTEAVAMQNNQQVAGKGTAWGKVRGPCFTQGDEGWFWQLGDM